MFDFLINSYYCIWQNLEVVNMCFWCYFPIIYDVSFWCFFFFFSFCKTFALNVNIDHWVKFNFDRRIVPKMLVELHPSFILLYYILYNAFTLE